MLAYSMNEVIQRLVPVTLHHLRILSNGTTERKTILVLTRLSCHFHLPRWCCSLKIGTPNKRTPPPCLGSLSWNKTSKKNRGKTRIREHILDKPFDHKRRMREFGDHRYSVQRERSRWSWSCLKTTGRFAFGLNTTRMKNKTVSFFGTRWLALVRDDRAKRCRKNRKKFVGIRNKRLSHEQQQRLFGQMLFFVVCSTTDKHTTSWISCFQIAPNWILFRPRLVSVRLNSCDDRMF